MPEIMTGELLKMLEGHFKNSESFRGKEKSKIKNRNRNQ